MVVNVYSYIKGGNMKRIVYLLLIIIMMPTYVSADTFDTDEYIVASNTRYFKTITRTKSSVNVIANNNSDIVETTTIEISEEEYNSVSNDTLYQPLSTAVETTYKRLTSNISKSGSQYKYTAILSWKNVPKVRSYDILGIGYLPSVKIDGDITFTQKYCNDGNCTTSTSFTSKKTSTGCSAIFKLPSSTIDTLEQRMSFLVEKNTSYNIVSQVAAGDYAHATSTVTQSNAQNHTISESGLSLKTSIFNSYDTISTAKATWSGTW